MKNPYDQEEASCMTTPKKNHHSLLFGKSDKRRYAHSPLSPTLFSVLSSLFSGSVKVFPQPELELLIDLNFINRHSGLVILWRNAILLFEALGKVGKI
jgi:hypothetical protein